MIRWMFRWLFTGEMLDEYSRGWKDGVNQEHYDPKSSAHGLVSERMYWDGED
jgi:hypothetical protein